MDDLVARLRNEVAPDVAERIVELIRSTIRIELTPEPDGDISLGASKFGGQPDLPPEVTWPTNESGALLPFLAQIDCAVLPKLSGSYLPETGLLSFFYNNADRAAPHYPESDDEWAVLWHPHPTSLVGRTEDRQPHQLEAGSCAFHLGPSFDVPWSDLSGDYEEEEYLEDLKDELDTMYGPIHRMMGVAVFIQQPVTFEVAAAVRDCYRRADPECWESARNDAADWEVLLQFDSDDRIGAAWGDAGIVSFAIRRDDLARRAFDHVRVNFQCY